MNRPTVCHKCGSPTCKGNCSPIVSKLILVLMAIVLSMMPMTVYAQDENPNADGIGYISLQIVDNGEPIDFKVKVTCSHPPLFAVKWTDEEGHAEFSFPSDPDLWYRCRVVGPGRYYSESFTVDRLYNGATTLVTLELEISDNYHMPILRWFSN